MLIDKNLLDDVSRQAQKSSRLRMNYNFHPSHDCKVQRLLNALEPGTELPIHRHLHTDEIYIVLRGAVRVMYYDENKSLVSEHFLAPKEGKYGLQIPAGQWHSLEVLQSGTVIFEVKEGPYAPLEEKDILK